MKHNGFRYGVLSSYTQTWFLKRVVEDNNEVLLLSPTIRFDRRDPTLLQCYLWLIRTAPVDAKMPEKPTLAKKVAMRVNKTIDKVKRSAGNMLPTR